MLGVLLGRNFAAKCKSLIKLTKSRIEVIRRKRRATERFLKKDIADLLFNGLDINAYGRAEGLFVELTLSYCYGFVEKSCELVLKHLSVMQKLSGCPEECRPAVSSLMFAAARFSDLPELRDLRQIFQERYGNSLECYVNQEFAANLNFKSPTLEKKVCLMQEIASEFSINWDSKAFKLRMSRSSAFAQGQNACMRNHLSDYDKLSLNKDFTLKEVNNDVWLEKNADHANDGYKLQNGKDDVILNRDDRDLQSNTVPGNGLKRPNGFEVLGKKGGHDNPLAGRQEVAAKKSDRIYWKEGSMLSTIGRSPQEKTEEQFEGGPKLHASWGNTTPPKENLNTTTARKSSNHIGLRFRSNAKEPFAVILNRDDHDLQLKSTVPGNGFKPLNGCEVLGKKDGHDNPLTGRQEVTSKKSDRSYRKEGSMLKPIGRSSQEKTVELFEGGSKLHDSWGNTPPRENLDTTNSRKSPCRIGSLFRSNVKEPSTVNLVVPSDTHKSERKVQDDETPILNPCYSNAIPPPYVKPNSKQQNSMHGVNVASSHTDSDGFFTCHSAHDKSEQTGLDNSDQDWQARRHERLGKKNHKNEFFFCEVSKETPMIKPKSMRRKHSRSRSTHYDAPKVDTELVRKQRSRSRRRDESRRGLWFNDEQYQNAEEERIIDKLLIHYSKKPSILVPEKLSKKSSSHRALLIDNSTRKLLQNGSGNGSDETPEMTTLAPRSISLPREQPNVVEVKKEFAHAASFQHVHPKLPDYDDLAARFAALKGR